MCFEPLNSRFVFLFATSGIMRPVTFCISWSLCDCKQWVGAKRFDFKAIPPFYQYPKIGSLLESSASYYGSTAPLASYLISALNDEWQKDALLHQASTSDWTNQRWERTWLITLYVINTLSSIICSVDAKFIGPRCLPCRPVIWLANELKDL